MRSGAPSVVERLEREGYRCAHYTKLGGRAPCWKASEYVIHSGSPKSRRHYCREHAIKKAMQPPDRLPGGPAMTGAALENLA